MEDDRKPRPEDDPAPAATPAGEPGASHPSETNAPTVARARFSPEGGAGIPEWIGDYRVLGVLGRGGMGVVYEAEQQHPKRVIALKVIRGEATTDEAHVAMFRREVEVLARLEHPMIARIYESGRTDDGQHYFAMELVRGETLTEFLRRHPGPPDSGEVRRRLALLASIAEAVNYAHMRGVIHRDLKPSNLIVTEESEPPTTGSGVRTGGSSASRSTGGSSARTTGGSGAGTGPRVKILDFGVARMTDGDVNATRVTEIGMLKGTLPYMSPEQARGRSDDIDLRTDVYALGVILYEMLTGALPNEVTGLGIIDALKVIDRGRIRPLRDAYTGPRRLDEDLETIVGKALEKDVDGRYGSAAALAEDIRRYLVSLPILAKPHSALYHLRKLVRRNPLPAAFAASVFILTVAFAGVMAWQARRIALERDRAQAEADRATAISQFLQETLQTPNPFAGGERQITVLESLDRSLGRMGNMFQNQPLVEAGVREIIGETLSNLGQYAKAEPLLRRALELRIAQQGPQASDTGVVYGKISRMLHLQSRYDEAEKAALAGVEAERASGEPGSIRLAERLNDLGYVYLHSGRPDEAEKHVREAIAIGRATGTPTYALGDSEQILGDVLSTQGKLDEAAALTAEAAKTYEAVLGPDNPMSSNAKNSHALILMQKGDYAEAERQFLEAIASIKRSLGERHPLVATELENLGNVYYRQKQLDRTVDMLDQAIAIRKEAFGPDHALVGRSYANRGTVLNLAGRTEESEAAYREALPRMRAGLGPDSPDVAAVLSSFAAVLDKRGKRDEGEAALREALRIRASVLGAEHVLTAQTRIALGLHLANGKVSTGEARSLIEAGLAVLAPSAGEEDARVKAARAALSN